MTPQRRVVVASAEYGSGYGRVAEAVADHLRRYRGARLRVVSLDLLARCAPRSARLAALAYRGGEAFFPDGRGTLAETAAAAPDDPLLRELAAGGVASASAALAALEPDLVLAVHPVAAAIAAEAAADLDSTVMAVLGDLWPRRLWLHPGVRLWFVGGAPARDALAARGVAWAGVAVSGVPVPEPPDRASTKARLAKSSGLEDRFTVTVALRDGAAEVAEGLAARGIQVLLSSDEPVASASARPGLVHTVSRDESPSALLAVSDAVICRPCGSLTWEAPAAGVPMIAVEPVTPMERSSIDLLATAGAALVARSVADAVARAEYLASDPGRLATMAREAAAVGRPLAAQAVCERALADSA